MSAIHGRRGVVYTIVALLILLSVGALFFTQSRRSALDAGAAVEERVRAIDRFIQDVQTDSERAARIAGFRSLIAMEQEVASTGGYFADPNTAFLDVFWDGNLSGATFQVMANSSFSEYLLRVQELAGMQGIALNASVTSLQLSQEDPWNLLVEYTIAANITDTRGTARWSVVWNGTGRVPITDLRDPLFTAQTLGRVQRVIRQTNTTDFITDGANQNDTSQLLVHYNESRYAALGRGPDILMRFAGNISDSAYGIESLVDVEELDAQDIVVNTGASVVDYLYFNGTLATVCSIQNLPVDIKLDTASAAVYGVTGALTSSTC